MVRGSDKTYGELMLEAAAKSDHQEVGETSEALMERFKDIIEDAVQKNYDKGVRGKYYIHIWLQKEPYAQNAIRIYPQCRRTRPSPYQGHDHYLWSVEDGGLVNFCWCIPKKEVVNHILSHPNDFDADYVRLLKSYVGDKIETLNDYRLGIKGKEHMVG
jgi:hypothetical protein